MYKIGDDPPIANTVSYFSKYVSCEAFLLFLRFLGIATASFGGTGGQGPKIGFWYIIASMRNNLLAPEIQPILEFYQDLEERLQKGDGQEKIKVGDTFSSVASFYERVRYTIDFKKENLLRRNAIERIIKRLLWEKGEGNLTALAETLIKELIWAKYVPNNFYPAGKVAETSAIIAKYLTLAVKFEKGWKDWLMGLASCEIEESLDPSLVSYDVFSMAIESWFKKNFDWTDVGLSDEEKENQLAVAIHRSLFRSDEQKNAYFLVRRLVKGWNRLDESEVANRGQEIVQALAKIRASLKNPQQAKLYRYVQKQVAAFQILKNLIEEGPTAARELMAKPDEFTQAIYEICEDRYDEIKQRVNLGIVRSIIYIFVTKIIFAIAIEIPYEVYFLQHLSWLPLVSTVIVPILFVFLVALTIRRPGNENTAKIAQTIFDFVYAQPPAEKVSFSLSGKKKGLSYQVFSAIYGILFVLVFSLIAYFLAKAGYDIIGIGIFFIFLSLVLLFAYRVKFSASELNVTTIKESLASHLMTNLTLPFLDLGVWLADKFASLNFFILLFDFLVEAPLKNIIGILNEWTTYLKERKEEAIEIPVER